MASSQAVSRVHQLLDEHWTTTLSVEPSVWRDADVVVASHPEPSHTDHVYLIRRDESCIIVVPQGLVGLTTATCASWPSAAVFDKAFIRSVYGDAVAAIHGPFWLGYATAESFRAVDGRGTRLLQSPEDAEALRDLGAVVPEEEWVDAGFAVASRREYGCWGDGHMVAAGTLTPFQGRSSNVGVLTHPAHRGAGFGSAVLSALTADALTGTDVAQCRTFEENHAAVRMAKLLGYVEDGHTLEVVLRHPPSGEYGE